MTLRSVLACTLFATIAQAGVAQQPGRPRVGLVLGGGGARGAAHVGVLRVIDELRIPVDAIAGTSMGAIVGALYAIGLSPAEIESRFQTADWDAVFDNRPSRRSVEYRRKQDDPHLLVRFELGFGGGRLRLPAGLVEPHRANLLLRTLTLPAAGIHDFDRLPIPFRAVATDIATGEVVVLDHGDLAEAILASMSIPGVFAPVNIEGRLLVDGGVVRNLPVDVARSMDVDVLIVVDVGTPLTGAAALRSAVEVYGQTLTIFVRANSDAQIGLLGGGDILVAPDLGSIGTDDFHRVAEAIETGYVAADRLRHRLELLGVTPSQYAAARARLPEPSAGILEFVRLENGSRFSDRLIGGRLGLHAGDTVSSGTLNAAINRVWGLGVFDKVDFRFVQEADRRGLVVRTTEKPWGPNYLRFGLGLTDEPDGNSTFDLRANLAMTGLNTLGADLRAEFRAGEIRGMSVELYQPATWSGRLFVAPRLQVRHTPGDAFESRVRIAQYDIEQRSIGFDAGTQLGTWGQFRIGIEHRAVDAKPEIGDPSLPRFDVAHRVLGARLDIDRLDNVLFPEDGLLASVLYERGSSADSVRRFDRVLGNLLVAGTRGPHSLLAGLHLGTALGSGLPLYEEFELGGFMWLSGLRRRQIAGRYLGLARLMYYRRVGDAVGFSVAGGLRLGGSIEIGNAWQAPPAAAANALRFGGSIFAAIETVLGPLYGGYGIGDRGQRAWYLLLGQPL